MNIRKPKISKTKQRLINKRAKIKARYDSVRESMSSWSKIPVPYPFAYSEAEIQASLWSSLRKVGFDVRMEVKHQIKPRGTPTRQQISRFDLVVYRNKKAFCIIEVKPDKVTKKGAITQANMKQLRKYARYDAELIYCIGRKDIFPTINKVKVLHNKLFSNIEYSNRGISPLTVQSAGGTPVSPEGERLIGAALAV